ncbi:MAG: GntR family transcriptional regulator [Acidimicrobiales bacterium]
MPLDVRSGVPLYMQVERSLRTRIVSGEWMPGQQIPTEDQLCSTYGVSRITVRQAVANLVAQGMIAVERGRGRFVRDSSVVARERSVTSFTTELLEMGLKAGSLVLDRAVLTAAEAMVADELDVEPTSLVVRWKRLRTGDGEPMGLQTSVLPIARFPGLEEVDLEGRSLYAVLFERYGLLPAKAVDTFTVGSLKAFDAGLLNVEIGSPAFLVERLTFATDGPFEYTQSVMRGDRYRVRLVLATPPQVAEVRAGAGIQSWTERTGMDPGSGGPSPNSTRL